MKVTVLGCGGSGGVPMIGGVWGACNPANPKNRRRRVSVLVQTQGKNILIDCGPDLREQLIDVEMTHLDAVLLTHTHSDHVQGIDDLRKLFFLNHNTPIPLYGAAKDLAELKQRFAYAFRPFRYEVVEQEPLQPVVIEGAFSVAGIPVTPIVQDHGHHNSTSLGFRIGDFAYSTDVNKLDEAAFAALAGVKVWVVDCLREAPHPAHSHLAQTLGWIARVQPQQAYLTHMDISLDYDTLLAKCPPGVAPAHDGLEISL